MRLPSGVVTVLAVVLHSGVGLAASPPSGQTLATPPKLPPGVSATLWRLSVPPGSEPTPEKVALGEKLFREKRLSVDNTVACMTCHEPELGFTDGKPLSEGVRQQKVTRNSPTVLNALFNATQFWDGRAGTLEDQAKLPILNPREMGMPDADTVVRKVRGIPEYVTEFRQVFGREVNYDDLAAAIAAFERTQYSGNARFDQFITGDSKALTASEKNGWALFNGKARCNSCHAGNAVSPLFSDQKFHNIGVAAHKQDFVTLARKGVQVVRTGDEKQIDELALNSEFSELGRFLVTKQENDVGSFKTPTLRNVGITGPYMHDGSLPTLWDVMDHYNKGGVANPYLDGGMQRLGLTEPEIDDLVAFLFALTDTKFDALNKEQLAKQRARKNTRPERDTAIAMGKKGNLGDLAPNPDLAVKNPADLGIYGDVTPVTTTQRK
ncbi:cytochrome-c peroxidase [Corallococcus sp. Z5C101001]|uniref:cytochrome-c peroxidase n=1 Tax=Corallococcus sp. Z5C101001 TaxID=2596829 RepID=UPI00117CCF92|nr:cytochrome c peroxidase [Corallococcus sp. Z5C101001]TSC28416.1 cytochrome-c peroxidase [Corallococcus sp. Z5C101001]